MEQIIPPYGTSYSTPWNESFHPMEENRCLINPPWTKERDLSVKAKVSHLWVFDVLPVEGFASIKNLVVFQNLSYT